MVQPISATFTQTPSAQAYVDNTNKRKAAYKMMLGSGLACFPQHMDEYLSLCGEVPRRRVRGCCAERLRELRLVLFVRERGSKLEFPDDGRQCYFLMLWIASLSRLGFLVKVPNHGFPGHLNTCLLCRTALLR